jgi:acyl-CoA oxidase
VPAAQKFMPNTSIVGGAKTAVVAARLQAAGRDQGVFLFLVPLHDGRAPHPGVRIRGLPAKLGSPVDHCLTAFDRLRLPRHALLESEHGRLSPDGRLTSRYGSSRRRFLHSIGRVTVGKLCMTAASLGATRVALALAWRYARIRHTSSIAGGHRSVPLLAHRSHQSRLLDAVVSVYAATLLHRSLIDEWAAAGADADRRGRAERSIAIAKGWITWQMRHALLEARERCGAQGMFAVNGITDHLLANEGTITAEGDNLAIWVKAAGELLLDPPPPVAPAAGDLADPAFLRHLLERVERLWLERAVSALRGGTGGDALARWNDASGHALRAVNAHAERSAAAALHRAADTDSPARDALRLVHRAFALRSLAPHTGQLLAAGDLTPEAVRAIPDLHEQAVARLADHGADLVDAFALPEPLLDRHPLGQPDFDTLVHHLERHADLTTR